MKLDSEVRHKVLLSSFLTEIKRSATTLVPGFNIVAEQQIDQIHEKKSIHLTAASSQLCPALPCEIMRFFLSTVILHDLQNSSLFGTIAESQVHSVLSPDMQLQCYPLRTTAGPVTSSLTTELIVGWHVSL